VSQIRMAFVLHVMDIMSNRIITSASDEPISKVASTLIENDVGSIVVVDGEELLGIITKGDILRKVLLRGLDPKKTPAEKVMSPRVVTIDSDATLEKASKLMIEKKVSKLPVVSEEGRLVGIVTSTDIIRAEPAEIGYLQELIRARFVPHELR
jgi:CBS domain-containing protein